MAELEVRRGLWVAYRRRGSGPLLVCVPGGPGRAAAYLGDLGGLDRDFTLVTIDLPGTGGARAPSDPSGYELPALADAVQAVVADLGSGPVALLGHSAGVLTATLWATRAPERVRRLVLLAPGGRQIGLTYDDAEAVRASRSAEPWYADAVSTDDWTPFFYGRWDDAARRHAAAEDEERSIPGTEGFGLGGVEPAEFRAALARLDVPALVVGGTLDPLGTAISRHWAQLLPRASLATVPGVAHYPWLDDAQAVRRTVTAFLSPDAT